jgi:hypothetical protein
VLSKDGSFEDVDVLSGTRSSGQKISISAQSELGRNMMREMVYRAFTEDGDKKSAA